MKLDFATFAFGYRVLSGGGTPNWATALGQGREYKINENSQIDELLRGIIYCSIGLEKVSSKIGKGGAKITGDSSNSPFVLAALFRKVFVNDILIPDGKFILLITRDDSASHAGRLRVKYGPSNTYIENGNEVFSNQNFFQKVRETLGLTDDACWFVSELNIINQNELHLKTIVVKADGSVDYADSEALHKAWEILSPGITRNVTQHNKGRQHVYFGAPGTGKSFSLNAQAEADNFDYEHEERVTFYPTYTYQQFVGAYKPSVDDNKQITYTFVPGPFLRLLLKAYQNPGEEYLLIIEELNRANAATVFGDSFQLLDREKNGISEYPVEISEDMKKYFMNEDAKVNNTKIKDATFNYTRLIIPSNFYIWATMNSADQGVFPIDTAFKRRWDFEYLGIDDKEDKISGKKFKFKDGWYEWNTVRKTINNALLARGINEDKQLGPFFLKLETINGSNEQFLDAFKSKVLMYLFEDAARHCRSNIFNTAISPLSYSNICKTLDTEGLGKVFRFIEEANIVVSNNDGGQDNE